MNLRQTQRPIVYAHVVDDSVEIEATYTSPNVHIDRGVYLRRWDGADQNTVVQYPIHINIQFSRRRVINACHMIPDIQ